MIGPCDRCGRDGAEYITVNFCLCSICDKPPTEPDWIRTIETWRIPAFDEDPPTDPGGCTHTDEYDTWVPAGYWQVWCVDCGRFLRNESHTTTA